MVSERNNVSISIEEASALLLSVFPDGGNDGRRRFLDLRLSNSMRSYREGGVRPTQVGAHPTRVEVRHEDPLVLPVDGEGSTNLVESAL